MILGLAPRDPSLLVFSACWGVSQGLKGLGLGLEGEVKIPRRPVNAIRFRDPYLLRKQPTFSQAAPSFLALRPAR